MAVDIARLSEIEALLGGDVLTDTDLATRLNDAGLPELARVVRQLAQR